MKPISLHGCVNETAGGGMCHAESDTTFTGVESDEAPASGKTRCATCDSYYPNPRCPNCREDKYGRFRDWREYGPDMDDFIKEDES